MMAIAAKPASSAQSTGSLGVYLPVDFPEEACAAVLEGSGCAPAFVHVERAEVLADCREQRPDVLLLAGIRLDAGIIALLGEVVEASPRTRVILICKRSGSGEVRKALDAGARGVVSLDEVAAALAPVIEVVRAGQLSVPGSRGAELEKRVLTAREKQILGLVVMGMTNAEIAEKLFLAESTVKSHLSSAFAKLGVASRSEAASLILDPRAGAGLGILTIPSS